MTLLIDNYDSFSYNLYQLIGSIDPNIRVIRNDEMTIEQLRALEPERIVLSPGPGKPSEAGICEEVVKEFGGMIPILGVCLGHQAIFEAFGGVVSHAKRQMHGKQSQILLDRSCPLFDGLAVEISVARYHSLAACAETLPDTLRITATSEDGEIMAVQHNDYQIYGLQFHPESIMTPQGHIIIKNFLEIREDRNND